MHNVYDGSSAKQYQHFTSDVAVLLGSNATPVELWGKKIEDKKEIWHMTYIGFPPWQSFYLTFLPFKLFLHCCCN